MRVFHIFAVSRRETRLPIQLHFKWKKKRVAFRIRDNASAGSITSCLNSFTCVSHSISKAGLDRVDGFFQDP